MAQAKQNRSRKDDARAGVPGRFQGATKSPDCSWQAFGTSEEHFRLLVENSYDIIYEIDREGVFTFISPSVGRLLGWESSQLKGRSAFDFIHPEDVPNVGAALANAVASPGVRSGLRYRFRHENGSWRWYQSSALPRIDAAGRVVAFVGNAHDVTKEMRAEDKLRESEARFRVLNSVLERRVSARTAELESFSHTIAHDLKTPLRGVDGFAGMLLEDEGERLTDEGRRMLVRIRAASQRGGQLIDELLRFSRITRAILHISRIDLSALAAQVAQRIEALDPGRRIDWVIGSGLTADADAGLLEEVFEQLFANAWKFTAKVERARIEFGASESDGREVFFVRDNGAGFDMAHVGELFGPFHRAHTDAEFPGLGIGLAIVEKIVQKHGGTIRVEGEPGKGATVSFNL